MKPLVCILAAAVLSGLGMFFLLNSLKQIAMQGNIVLVNVVWFVAFVAALTTVSAAIAVLLQRAIARADYNMVAKLEKRVRALEQGPASLSAEPAPPPPVD